MNSIWELEFGTQKKWLMNKKTNSLTVCKRIFSLDQLENCYPKILPFWVWSLTLLTFTNAYSGNDFDKYLSLNVSMLFQKKSYLRSEGQETVLCNAKHYRHYKLINLQDWTPAVLSQGALHSLRFYSVRRNGTLFGFTNE